MNVIKELIVLSGSEENLGKIFGVCQQTISKWKRKGVPPKKCKKIQSLINKKFGKFYEFKQLSPKYF